MGLHAIKHEAWTCPKADLDRAVKGPAAEVASRLICTTLNINGEEERYRFGFAV